MVRSGPELGSTLQGSPNPSRCLHTSPVVSGLGGVFGVLYGDGEEASHRRGRGSSRRRYWVVDPGPWSDPETLTIKTFGDDK